MSSITWNRLNAVCVIGCLLAVPSLAEAQMRGFGGGRSAFGGGGMSGGRFVGGRGGSSVGNFGFGSSGMFGAPGGNAFGSSQGVGGTGFGGPSAFGGGRSGGTGGGMGPQLGTSLGSNMLSVTEDAYVGMTNPSSGFVGDWRVSGGSQYGGGRYGGSRMGRGFGGQRFGGGFGRSRSWGRDDNDWNDWDGGDWNNEDEQDLSVRAQLEIGFDVAADSGSVSDSRFQERFSQIVGRAPALAGVDFESNGSGTVVLTGEVPDDAARDLAIALFSLEPGVRKVVDNMTIAGRQYE